MTDTDSVELKLAKAIRTEAEQHHKAGDEAFAKAEYERGQIEHAKRLIEQTERGIAARERWLEQHDEAKVRAIVAGAEQKLAEAQELMKDYDKEKHAAAIYLRQRSERDAAEQVA